MAAVSTDKRAQTRRLRDAVERQEKSERVTSYWEIGLAIGT